MFYSSHKAIVYFQKSYRSLLWCLWVYSHFWTLTASAFHILPLFGKEKLLNNLCSTEPLFFFFAIAAEHVSDENVTDRWGNGSGGGKIRLQMRFPLLMQPENEQNETKGSDESIWKDTESKREREKLTLSLQPCPGMRCWPCPPLLGWLCSWRSVLGVSCPTESRAQQSKTLRHVSHSTHCTHLSASTRPAKRWRGKTQLRVGQSPIHQTKQGNKSVTGTHLWKLHTDSVHITKPWVISASIVNRMWHFSKSSYDS